jgi:uncharacterized protein (DUF305 family)
VKFFAALVAAAAAILLSSSCSSPDPEPQSTAPSSAGALAPAAFNDADVAFVNGMIPHHQQAIDMSAMVPTRSTNDAVIKLAADVSAAQTPEIQVMKVLLVQWNSANDPQAADQDQHQDHGDMAMDGTMDPATMGRLESLQGTEFDTLWLQSMIGHHEGAITMAQTELASGTNDDAKRLAQQIITAQQGEITQMKQMLGA